MLIGGLAKSSLIDYPDKISAIVFTFGCNFRCGYCHNPELINVINEPIQPLIAVSAFFDFLKTRLNKLDGVVITGGEPTLQKDLKEFIKEIKNMGFLVKLDTNGTKPEILEDLINENLLNYIAMDIKAPFEKYSEITRTFTNTKKIQKSIGLIMNSNLDYEFRTTVLKKQLSFDDFKMISEIIKGAKKYYLQKFVPTKILNEKLIEEKTYRDEDFKKIKEMLSEKIKFVDVR